MTSAGVALQNHIATVVGIGVKWSKVERVDPREMSMMDTKQLAAEKTSPASVRAALHHEGSWNSDTTFEPQPD